jgi:hypothetical protein
MMITSLKSKILKQNQFTLMQLAALLCLLLTGFFTTIVKDWRFFDDDYGAIYTATTVKSNSDLLDFFGPKDNDLTILPTNILETYKPSFSKTSFRPLTLIWYFLVSKILNPHNPQHYFLFSIFLHILATLLLFFAFLNYLSPQLAFFAALLFGIFPFNGKFLGRFVIQPYSLCLILNLLGYFSVQNYFTKNKLVNSLIAASCFLCSVLLHEASYSYLFLYYTLFLVHRIQDRHPPANTLFLAGLDTIPFLAALFSCILAKYLIYPPIATESFLVTLAHKLKFRLYDFVTLIVDAVGYSPIPEGHRFLKASLLAIDAILFLLLMLFGGNAAILILLGLFATQSWPSILIMHVSRYLYFSLPYFILALFVMYSRLHNNFPEKILKKILQIKYFAILALGFFSIRASLLYLEKKFTFVDNAIKTFSAELEQKKNNESLCFAGLPFDYFPISGLAQAIWFYTGNDNRKIFYDHMHAVRFAKIDFLPNQNFCKIEYNQSDRLLHIQTNKQTSAYILTKNPFGQQISCATGTVIKADTTNSLKDKSENITIHLYEQLFPIRLITWDQEGRLFKSLKE